MIQAELLQDANDTLVATLVKNPRWVFQEKHNGDRRMIEKRGDGTVLDYNRRGDKGKGLPPAVIKALRECLLYQFIIDVELVKNQIFVFDAMYIGVENLVLEPYSYREAMYHAHFDGISKHIIPVKSAKRQEEKCELVARLNAECAEGFVMKDLTAIYRPGMRCNYRFKFVKTLDAVVIGDSKERDDKGMLKNSVRLGCYDKYGKLKDICGATKKSSFTLKPGDVVKIFYLYGTGTLDVVQPRIDQPRFDKHPEECTLDQIVINKNWR